MESDLSLVSTIDLVEELCSRFDHGAICLLKEDMQTTQRKEFTILSQWIGSHHMTVGILEQMVRRVLNKLEEETDLLDDLGSDDN